MNILTQLTEDNSKKNSPKHQKRNRPRRATVSTLKGSLWKKRGGLGGKFHLSNPWKKRAFVLVNGYLFYYEAENVNDISNRKEARGFLKLNDYGVKLCSGRPIAESPNNYTIVIETPSVNWKLCCNDSDEQLLWLTVLSQEMNESGWINEADAMNVHIEHPKKTPLSPNLKKKILKKKPRINFVRPRPDSSKLAREQILIVSILGLISSSFWAQYNFHPSFYNSIFAILIINIICYICLQKISKSNKKEMKRLANESEEQFENLKDKYNEWTTTILDQLIDQNNHSNHNIKSKRVKFVNNDDKDDDDNPLFDNSDDNFYESDNFDEERKGGSDIEDDGSLKIGQTLQNGLTFNVPLNELRNTWLDGEGELFRVRMGPNYSRTKKKEPSGPALYELIAVDVYRTASRLNHITKQFDISSDIINTNTNHPHVPPLFVVNCQVPEEPPSWYGSPEDGPGFHVIFYFRIKEETIKQLADIENASPSIRVLADYCERAPLDPKVRGKFKAMAVVGNIEVLNLPSVISRYNGKPVLITNSGNLIVGKGYYEMDINVHMFAYPARKGLHSLFSKFKEMILNIGFVIEGRGDDEQPEQILGCAKLYHLEPEIAGSF